MPDKMPEDMPDRMPDQVPEGMPDKGPECLPDRMPDRMSEDMPEDMPDRMPNRMPEDMPDRMPEDMPDRMSEDLPVTKRINDMVGITRSKVIFLVNVHRRVTRSHPLCPHVLPARSDLMFGVEKVHGNQCDLGIELLQLKFQRLPITQHLGESQHSSAQLHILQENEGNVGGM